MADPNAIKVAVCEYLLDVNRQFQEPPGKHPLIPPTAINWLGDGITAAVLATLDPPNTSAPTKEGE